MDGDCIARRLGLRDWNDLYDKFAGMSIDEITDILDEMFPQDVNESLAVEIFNDMEN